MSMNKRLKFSRYIALLIGIAVLCVILFIISIVIPNLGSDESVDVPEYSETINVGNGIVEALDNYRSSYGKYPTFLDELVPEYLAEIKSPTWGLGVWKYTLLDPSGNDFMLEACVKKKGRTGLYYNSATWKQWYYDSR